MLDVEERMLRKEYEAVWVTNEKIWEKRGVCFKQLRNTKDAIEHERLKVEFKRIESICEKTQEQCLVLFTLLYPPVVVDNYSDDSDDSDDYRLGDVC